MKRTTEQIDTRSTLWPKFIYCCFGGQLHRISIATGEQLSHRVPSYHIKFGSCWSEVPGASLLITGGLNGFDVEDVEVVRVDTRREFAVSEQPPMLTSRANHATVYHTQHLYVLGGRSGYTALRECERFVCAEHRWEALPPLPKGCSATSGVVVERTLYALGGCDREAPLDLVQKLSLESLTWELMQLRLPHTGYSIPCFKLRDTEVYLVVNKTLCSFTALEARPLKTLTEDIHSMCGESYYHRGSLYCSNWAGQVDRHEIGSLSS
jgi:hypothetical protein